MNIYSAYDHDRDLYEESYFISLNNDVQTIMLARTSLDTPQSCHEIHLTSTHAPFVHFLRYVSLNSLVRRERSTTYTEGFNDVSSSPLVLSVFFLHSGSRVCGWRFCEKQKQRGLTVPGDSAGHLETPPDIGRLRRTLGDFAGHWETLPDIGRLRRTLEGFAGHL